MAWKKDLFKNPKTKSLPFEKKRKEVQLSDGTKIEFDVKVYHTLDNDIGMYKIGFKKTNIHAED